MTAPRASPDSAISAPRPTGPAGRPSAVARRAQSGSRPPPARAAAARGTSARARRRGAAGRSGLYYDYEKGEITETETNTMKEDEPTTSQTSKAKTKKYLFENTSITDFYN